MPGPGARDEDFGVSGLEDFNPEDSEKITGPSQRCVLVFCHGVCGTVFKFFYFKQKNLLFFTEILHRALFCSDGNRGPAWPEVPSRAQEVHPGVGLTSAG